MKTIDAKTLKQWLNEGKAVLADVREPAEFDAEHIPGAQLVSLGKLCRMTLPVCEGKNLVVQCHGGRRGAAACKKLLAEMPGLEVYNLAGGIVAWKEAGYAVESSGRSFLSLDRQVQLAVGSVIVLSSLLGYFTHPIFFLLAMLLGGGLVFAGLTGYCGMAVLLAKMPWNQNEPIVGSCCEEL